jgi:hypothetical protein
VSDLFKFKRDAPSESESESESEPEPESKLDPVQEPESDDVYYVPPKSPRTQARDGSFSESVSSSDNFSRSDDADCHSNEDEIELEQQYAQFCQNINVTSTGSPGNLMSKRCKSHECSSPHHDKPFKKLSFDAEALRQYSEGNFN